MAAPPNNGYFASQKKLRSPVVTSVDAAPMLLFAIAAAYVFMRGIIININCAWHKMFFLANLHNLSICRKDDSCVYLIIEHSCHVSR